MTPTQTKAAFAISGISLAMILAHFIWPTIIILDTAVLGLVALAALPWFTLFFKKFKIPGVGEAETQDRTQSTTEKPLPPPTPIKALAAPAQPSADTMKLLATLWRYQRQSFKDDNTKRWTFRLTPAAKDYPRFLAGLSEALDQGWATVSPENDQCMLTNEGLAYVAGNQALQTYADVWTF